MTKEQNSYWNHNRALSPLCPRAKHPTPDCSRGLAHPFALIRSDEKHLESNKSIMHESMLRDTLRECTLIFSRTLHTFLWWLIYTWVTKSARVSLCSLKLTVTTCEQVYTHTAIMCVHIFSSSLDLGFLLVFAHTSLRLKVTLTTSALYAHTSFPRR